MENNKVESNGILVLVQGAIFVWSIYNSFPWLRCLHPDYTCPVTYFHIPDLSPYFNFFPSLSIYIAAIVLSFITIFRFYTRKGINFHFVITQIGLVAFNHLFLVTIIPQIVDNSMTV